MAGLAECGIQLLQLDVTDAASVSAAVATVVSSAGKIDILVNNAGIVTLGPSAEVPLGVVRQSFEANVFGLLGITQAAIPHMVQQGSGRIVNIGSLTGFIPVPLRGIYSATKGAVLRLSDALRVELKPLGIQDYACSYSDFARSLWGHWLNPLEAAMSKLLALRMFLLNPGKSSRCVTYVSSGSRYWVGPCAGIEWLVRWLPLWLQDRLAAKAFGLSNMQATLPANAHRSKEE
eukprot:gene4497-4750_t